MDGGSRIPGKMARALRGWGTIGIWWSTPPGVPRGLEGGTSKEPRVPLPLYDGKTDLRAFIAQFRCVARSNGWSQVQGAAQLTAALRGAALEVLTTVPEEGATLEDLYSALKNDLAWTSRASLLKLSSVGANDGPRSHWENWHTIFAARWGSHMPTCRRSTGRRLPWTIFSER